MDFQSWISNIEGLAGVYAFDILPDGSFSEIKLMAVNKQNEGIITRRPGAPKFYPGIPYREYWSDVNFEDYVHRCCTTNQPLYSYVNAHGFWLKGFYMPITEPGTVSALQDKSKPRTVYCLYVLTYSNQVDSDAMSKRSTKASEAVMSITVKLHETQDYYQAMSDAVREIRKVCGSKLCSLYTVDNSNQKCEFINENGKNVEIINKLAKSIGRSPYETAMCWEKDLASSDSLVLADLELVKERDPAWYHSLVTHEVNSIVLYAVRFNHALVGFIWAANFDISKMMQIKETLEMASFIIAAVVANHQLLSRLEERSTTDGLTQVLNRNAMNERVDKIVSGETRKPAVMGVMFVDLNGLKTVNDDEGHDAGDKLLRKAARLLKIVFSDYEIYRSGGDEFVVFCPGISEEKMEELTSQLRTLSENTADVSFAIGNSYCTGDYDIHLAMKSADERMYRDKKEYYMKHPEKDRRNQRRK